MDRSEIVTTSCVNAGMVDVRAPRWSVFPSVLQAYDSGFEPTKRQSFLRAKSQSAVKNSKEVVKRNSAKVSVKKDAQAKNGAKAGSSASIKSLLNRNDHEIELKRRRAKVVFYNVTCCSYTFIGFTLTTVRYHPYAIH